MENKEGTFRFTYSAKEQEEIRRIRKKYQPEEENKEEDKMLRLRRLDEGVTKKAAAISLIFGVLGTLIMGSSMSLVMTNLGEILGLRGMPGTVLAVVIGILGIVLICLAYPVYNKILKKEREKIAPEILRITEELMK